MNNNELTPHKKAMLKYYAKNKELWRRYYLENREMLIEKVKQAYRLKASDPEFKKKISENNKKSYASRKNKQI